jgi:hypothetical protein
MWVEPVDGTEVGTVDFLPLLASLSLLRMGLYPSQQACNLFPCPHADLHHIKSHISDPVFQGGHHKYVHCLTMGGLKSTGGKDIFILGLNA